MRPWPTRASRSRALLLGVALAGPVLVTGCGKPRAPASDAAAPSTAVAADAAPPAARAPVRLVIDARREVDQGLAWDERVLPRAAGEEALGRVLAAEPAFAPAPGAVSARLDFALGLRYEGAAGAEARVDVAVVLRLRWKDDGGTRTIETRIIGEQPLDKAARAALPERSRAALERAVADAVGVLAARDGIRRGDDAAVIGALGHADPDVRTEAYRALDDRKLVAALPRLVELLRSEDPEVRDAAIGGLVSLGDPRGVKPLVDLVEFKDLDMMRRIVDAVGQIGGAEAEAYLDFVASGHEVVEVRKLARGALDRLRRRDAGAGAGAP